MFSSGKLVCKSCNSKSGEILPIGIPYRPDNIDNGDIPIHNWRKHLNRLPTVGQAVFDNADNVNSGMFYFHCKDCDINYSLNNMTPVQVRAWAMKYSMPPLRKQWNRVLRGKE